MSSWVKPPMAPATASRRARRAKAQGGMCPACLLPLPEDLSETEVDHIIPRARGGPNAPWNKQLVHLKCNRSKSMKLTPEAEALAAEHGVVLHLPIPPSQHAYRPLTRRDSLREDFWRRLDRVPAEDYERVYREHLDEIWGPAPAAAAAGEPANAPSRNVA